MNSNQRTELAAKIAEAGQFRSLEIVSRQGKLLARLLRGGRKANPDVEQPLKLAKELVVWLEGVRDFWPAIQRAPESGREAPSLAEDMDLPTLLGAIGRDAQYLKRLTQGGMGMSPNVVEPLRVLAELIAKLETLQARWPELQGPAAVTLTPVRRRPNGSRIVDEMIASGELRLRRDRSSPDPLEKIISDSERLGGLRQHTSK